MCSATAEIGQLIYSWQCRSICSPLMLTLRQIAAIVLLSVLPGTLTIVPAQALPNPLDPARNLAGASAISHTPLPEEYIWTTGDVTALRPDHNKFPWNRPDLRVAPHLFRAKFRIAELPGDATLYVAGPREAHIFLNGHRLDDFYLNTDAPIGFHVFHTSAIAVLRLGENVLAIEAIRGRGIVTGASSMATQQLAYGEILTAKIVAAKFGVEAPALVVSNTAWRSTTSSPDTQPGRWSESGFDDSTWQPAESLGPIESNVDFFQWSADAGMYGWPGYMGISPSLRTFSLSASAVTHVFSGRASLANLKSLTSDNATAIFTVTNNSGAERNDADAPSILLDFGREVAGRLFVESGSPTNSTLSIAYGESEIEALATGFTGGQQGGNYLGTNLLYAPANGIARGPKSGFRYVRIRFLQGAPVTAFKSIRVEGIFYPVTYSGSFESSDPLLNRIWEVGAYTAHLCMQDGIWDAAKRDRGRWAGDLDVEGRVISTVFGDRPLTEETLRGLVPPRGTHVNGIPSYSALWITSLDNLYQHSGDKTFLVSQRQALLDILAAMDASLNADGLFENAKHQWLFVDWAPGLYAYTQESRTGTQFQYIRGYRAAATLLRAMDDDANAKRYDAQATRTLNAIHTLRDANEVTYGNTWQLNALAALVAIRSSVPTSMPTSSMPWPRWGTNGRRSTGFAHTGAACSRKERQASGSRTISAGPRRIPTSRCRPTAPAATSSRSHTAGRQDPPPGLRRTYWASPPPAPATTRWTFAPVSSISSTPAAPFPHPTASSQFTSTNTKGLKLISRPESLMRSSATHRLMQRALSFSTAGPCHVSPATPANAP